MTITDKKNKVTTTIVASKTVNGDSNREKIEGLAEFLDTLANTYRTLSFNISQINPTEFKSPEVRQPGWRELNVAYQARMAKIFIMTLLDRDTGNDEIRLTQQDILILKKKFKQVNLAINQLEIDWAALRKTPITERAHRLASDAVDDTTVEDLAIKLC